MSLAALQKLYGSGPRRSVMNRAIRAECPSGNAVLDALHAIDRRIANKTAAREFVRHDLYERRKELEAEREQLAQQIEAKYGIQRQPS